MRITAVQTLLPEGEELAAVDLGSNSFHLVVARYERGQLQVIDRLRETVRLAAGLGEDGSLSNDCLLYTSPSPRD